MSAASTAPTNATATHRGCGDVGFEAQAVSHAYFAAFYATEAALLALGETRSKHSGVVSAFVHLLVRGGQLDEEIGRLLRSLFERRNQADPLPVEVPAEEADAAIRDAERGDQRGADVAHRTWVSHEGRLMPADAIA